MTVETSIRKGLFGGRGSSSDRESYRYPFPQLDSEPCLLLPKMYSYLFLSN